MSYFAPISWATPRNGNIAVRRACFTKQILLELLETDRGAECGKRFASARGGRNIRMPQVMIGIPMSASTWILFYSVMWVPVVVFYAVLFSVGTRWGEEESTMTPPIGGEPTKEQAQPKHERPAFPHAA